MNAGSTDLPHPDGARVTLRAACMAAAWVALISLSAPTAWGQVSSDPATSSAESAEPATVLVLYSYHPGHAWSEHIGQGLRAEFRRQGMPVRLLVSYMDTKREVDAEYIQRLGELYRVKYRHETIDLIVTADDNAFRFCQAQGRELFGDVPIVFCGVNDPDVAELSPREGITGVIERPEVGATFRMARVLSPEAHEVVCIADMTPTGRGLKREALEQIRRNAPDLPIRWLEDLTVRELQQQLSELDKGSIVMLLVFNRDRQGRVIESDEATRLVSASSGAPVYGWAKLYMGEGIVGGYLSGGEDQGRMAAQMAAEVLRGRAAEDIPIVTAGLGEWVFDARQMARFQLDTAKLPESARLVGRHTSFLTRHWKVIVTVGLAVAGLMLLNLVLLANTVRRRRAERAQRRSEVTLRQVLDLVPHRIFAKDALGRYALANRATASVMGLSPEDLVGQKLRDVHQLGSEAQRYLDDDQEVIRTGRSKFIAEERYTDAQGRVRYLQTTKIPLDDPFTGERSVLGVSVDITDQRRAEQALRESEERFRRLIETMNEGLVVCDANGLIAYANDRFAEMLGLRRDELDGRSLEEFLAPEDIARVRGDLNATAPAPSRSCEIALVSRGRKRHVLFSAKPVHSADGQHRGGFAVVADLTEQKALQEQLRQAQKMEAIGRLAGGVAHDFNNQLTVIKGYCELVLPATDGNENLHRALGEIRRATLRAERLTSQLLAFSRRQVLRPEVVSLHEVTQGLTDALQRMIGEDIELVISDSGENGCVEVDRGYLEQAIMNLAANARDAMPHGGRLLLETNQADALERVDAEGGTETIPGPLAVLTVSDTGEGMDAETRDMAFDPFFTTKETGQGTGLGLSMVYGFVRQSGGRITVDSSPGEGTGIAIYLPITPKAGLAHHGSPEKARPRQTGHETIMVCEDDEAVRALAVRMLRDLGYTVLETGNAREAIPLGEHYDGPIDLLISDVIMPDIRGPELARRLRSVRQHMPVLFISGYAEDTAEIQDLLASGAAFLPKPFRPDQLAAKVRELIDGTFVPTTLFPAESEDSVGRP